MLANLSPFFTEPLKVERLTVAIADLPLSLQGIKIIQLSDFHYDNIRLSEDILEDMITITQQEKPDLIALTGDYITKYPQPIYSLILYLKQLKSRYGIYAVLGNHDLYHPLAKMSILEAFKSVNISVLWNEIATPFGDDFPIVGLADYWSKAFNPDSILAQIDPQIPRLLLAHNPDSAAKLVKWRVDLQLSGHTHGGQATIPYLGSIPTLLSHLRPHVPLSIQNMIPFWRVCSHVVKNWQWAQGLHSVGDNLLYVNRGLGSYFPGRLFYPPELTVITLVKGNRERGTGNRNISST